MDGTIIAAAATWIAIWVNDRFQDRAARPDSEWADADLDDALATLGAPPEGLSLAVRCYQGPRGKGIRVRVAGVWPRLTLGPGRSGEPEIGDPEFDRTFSCRGPRAAIHAAMDSPTRAALLRLARDHAVRPGSLSVGDGVLRIDVPRRKPWQEVARMATDVALRLVAPADMAMRLADNARHDPEAGVRLSSLRVLLREDPGGDKTQSVLAAVMTDGDPEMRLEAARGLPAQGRPMLLALATDESVDDSCSARAVDGLRAATVEELRAVMDSALGAAPAAAHPRRPYTARACAESLGRLGEDAVPLLARALTSGNAAVGRAAIRSLERVGTAAAVLPLMEAAARDKSDLGPMAARAVADVQSGLNGTPGGMSLAGGDAGQVSVVDDAHGRVCLPEPGSAGGRAREVS